ncbi:KpsF/GutQ family sugar-phosphate isomerase [Parasulfitobacter algicola]|uniref:KpsF/GutQ family sugar-phosphate isomerase n=1 Tax=Parasulfitobacter algicola TaxID=2614809 RepID=A0ABX2IPF1_9RHOB|nr:KpsF/GutQ family sugar-phosphate isomerase [Sulfitobacter algicola]NSX53861.1 KpsF/GutQ family sugar-phosphate isomerase [Sulfitobacter algicola]
MVSSPKAIKASAYKTIQTEAQALLQMADENLDNLPAAVDLILQAKGRVILSGMGKSGHVARKIAATLASTGTPAQYVHPGEASHGDLGMITAQDVIIVLSNSGETTELVDLITYAKRFAIPMIAVTKVSDSTLGRQADVVLLLPDAPEACLIGKAPTTSTTCSLALGDALAIALMDHRGFKEDGFLSFHPGGKLGAQLLTVSALMHSGDDLPRVAPDWAMGDVLVEMTAKGFGIAAVVDQNNLLTGIVTDGDLRRNLENLMQLTAKDVATPNPRTIDKDALASEALGIMNSQNITALLVSDTKGYLTGLVRIHDCLRAGVA